MRDIDLKALVDTFDAAAQALGAEENIHAMRAGLVVSFHKLTKEELLDRLESAERRAEDAEKECAQQARLVGMGAERELALMAKLEAAERERDERRKDAERYRWLRAEFRAASLDMGGGHSWSARGSINRMRGPSFDAAVDREMAQEVGK